MGRRVRFNTLGHAHELTFSCYQDSQFLSDQEYCQYLAETISLCKQRYSSDLWAYVFMPTHVHLLLYPTSEIYDMAKILQGIKQSVSRRVMAQARKSNPEKLAKFSTGDKFKPYRFWQVGGGYDRNIVSRIALVKAIDYIHNNPVRAGLVKSADQWKWSSFRDWENMGSGPIGLDRDDIPLT